MFMVLRERDLVWPDLFLNCRFITYFYLWTLARRVLAILVLNLKNNWSISLALDSVASIQTMGEAKRMVPERLELSTFAFISC